MSENGSMKTEAAKKAAAPNVVVACFDGNDPKFPTLLTHEAVQAGVTEHTAVKDGPDQVRLLRSGMVKVRIIRTLHAEGYIEKFHQGIGVLLELPDGSTLALIFYNSGRTTDPHKVEESLASMARVLDNTDADIKVFCGVEFGEGDKGYNEHEIARKYFTSDHWREYFPDKRETMFVSRRSGQKVSDIDVVPGSSVAHQSPTREVMTLCLVKHQVTILLFHSAAGWTNGHRPSKVKELLGISWRRTLGRARRGVIRILVHGKLT